MDLEKIAILKYFLLCESLEPTQIKKTNAFAKNANYIAFNTKAHLLAKRAFETRFHLRNDENSICSFALFGSLFKIKNIQNKLSSFAASYTPNEEEGLGAGFALIFEQIDFQKRLFIYDAHEDSFNDDISLCPLIASKIDENTDFNKLTDFCDGSFALEFHSALSAWAKNEFEKKRTNQDKEDEKKHFYLALDADDVHKLYQKALELYGASVKFDPLFYSDDIQEIFIVSKEGTKFAPFMKSSYLASIQAAIGYYSKEDAPKHELMDDYLGSGIPNGRIDIKNIYKSKDYLGAYPFKNELNSSQKFSLASAFEKFCLDDDFASSQGFYSVNGAPGTGKTTILKEIVASIFLARAKKLATLNSDEIFIKDKLNPVLKGFDITIFSSNNKAVENVSGQIGVFGDTDDELVAGVDYFSSLATRFWGQKHWAFLGLKLGNKENIANFVFNFLNKRNQKDKPSLNDRFIKDQELCPELVDFDAQGFCIKGFLAYVKENTADFNTAKERFNAYLKQNPKDENYKKQLFLAALDLHKAAILSNSKQFTKLFMAFASVMFNARNTEENLALMESAWEALYFMFGAISSTFASFWSCFAHRSRLGTILIDEAGQSTLSSAIGALLFSKRAFVIGDPMQLEPIFTLPSEINDFLLFKCGVSKEFNLSNSSVQLRADRVQKYGTSVAYKDESLWLGSPLLAHKRCDEPIFAISNEIAYGNIITWDKGKNEAKLLNYWIDVPSVVNPLQTSKHARLEEILALKDFLSFYLHKGGSKDEIAVLSPFVDVIKLAEQHGINEKAGFSIGSVHTMQGRQAKTIVFVLGGMSAQARYWAAKKPNLLNVALTRARANFFVIGDLKAWQSLPYFCVLARKIAKIHSSQIERIFA